MVDSKRIVYLQTSNKFVLGLRGKEKRANESILNETYNLSRYDIRSQHVDPLRYRGQALSTLLDELSNANVNSETLFIFPLIKELICGGNDGQYSNFHISSAEKAASPYSLSLSQLLSNSISIISNEFYS